VKAPPLSRRAFLALAALGAAGPWTRSSGAAEIETYLDDNPADPVLWRAPWDVAELRRLLAPLGPIERVYGDCPTGAVDSTETIRRGLRDGNPAGMAILGRLAYLTEAMELGLPARASALGEAKVSGLTMTLEYPKGLTVTLTASRFIRRDRFTFHGQNRSLQWGGQGPMGSGYAPRLEYRRRAATAALMAMIGKP